MARFARVHESEISAVGQGLETAPRLRILDTAYQPFSSRGMPRGRKLSARELQVLGHLIRGRTNKMIAKLLGVSESTMKTFVTRIYEKREVRTRLDLLSLAIERGWVQNADRSQGTKTA